RAGPRHADNEDRLVARVPSRRAREALRRERRLHRAEQQPVLLDRVAERAALAGLRPLEEAERGLVLADVLVLLRERVAEMELAVDVVADLGEQRAEPHDVVARASLRVEGRERG